MIALYAITDHPGPALPDVAQLRAVPARQLAAVCAPATAGEVTAEALWSHERVVEALMADRDLLPVRYGTYAADDAAAAEALEARHDELRRSLDLVRGAVELAVRVLAKGGGGPPADEASPPQSGTEYLRRRGAAMAAENDAARTVHEPLAALARAAVSNPPSRPGELLRAAYLVNRDETERFTALVADLQARDPALAITCTGPWPAYSFSQP